MPRTATKKSAAEKTDKPSNGVASHQPLFFQDPHAIEIGRHAKAGLNGEGNFAFARATNSIPINAIEFGECMRSYPIVLSRDPVPMPLAVVGLRDTNYFVNKRGEWAREAYVPAYVRKYPFALVEVKELSQFVLCVDEKSAFFSATKAKLPFYDGETPTKTSQQALEFCKLFQQQSQVTVEFSQALVQAGVLEEKNITINLSNGQSVGMSGFMMIDEAKYRALPESKVVEWRKKGWLILADLLILSQINWRYLANYELDQ